jgi:hypothetical protein
VSAYVVVLLVPARRPAKRTRGKLAVPTHGSQHATLEHDNVKRLLNEHGAEVISSPVSNSAGDESPQSATLAVPDMACADRLAAALRELDGIQTAYAKPGEELP